jgi:hypothetical protein
MRKSCGITQPSCASDDYWCQQFKSFNFSNSGFWKSWIQRGVDGAGWRIQNRVQR